MSISKIICVLYTCTYEHTPKSQYTHTAITPIYYRATSEGYVSLRVLTEEVPKPKPHSAL